MPPLLTTGADQHYMPDNRDVLAGFQPSPNELPSPFERRLILPIPLRALYVLTHDTLVAQLFHFLLLHARYPLASPHEQMVRLNLNLEMQLPIILINGTSSFHQRNNNQN